MRIIQVDVQNYRKLKSCRIEFSKEKTVFVGANNSGKTSAMDALMALLKRSKRKSISTKDFTLSNWAEINRIAQGWIDAKKEDALNLAAEAWHPHVPTLDVWIHVEDPEVHYISKIIPSLDWTGGRLGVRLIFEPSNTEELYKVYKAAHKSARDTEGKSELKLWPVAMREFLEKKLHAHFTVNAYILDPAHADEKDPQPLPANSEPIDGDPFEDLFRIDIINAQRGFFDPNSDEGSNQNRKLSAQLGEYYERHLNPSDLPDPSDLDALKAIESAQIEFDKKLEESFRASIGELEKLNYPGFSDPKIQVFSDISPLDGLNHDAAVQFNLQGADGDSSDVSLCLPEQYNGLGYQNLISMIFSLIRFRDEWMQVGKAGKRNEEKDRFIEPLHIVLIEEPEAHLHAQVQQVFIKKSYDVLRNHLNLGSKTDFSTQLVISTHSSHIAHEIDFVSLRYFKRNPAKGSGEIPSAEVINLSTTFGDQEPTAKFASRYLKTTHCDLFFADAAILIEGPAERMLVPYFIRNEFPDLDRCYISMLEIGGSHAHQLKPLIEALGILTLVITDLDSMKEVTETDTTTVETTTKTTKIRPERGKGYVTGNDTVKSWVPVKSDLDEVLDASSDEKIKERKVRVSYQQEVEIEYSGTTETLIPYTFEDAIVLTNIEYFEGLRYPKGLIKKLASAVNLSKAEDACEAMFEALSKNSKKAEMALELLYSAEPEELTSPAYISEGLEWLKGELSIHDQDFLPAKPTKSRGGSDE
jgi:predicted ATP-dependent endonuclease of OLD family